jgi:hypothetical protein
LAAPTAFATAGRSARSPSPTSWNRRSGMDRSFNRCSPKSRRLRPGRQCVGDELACDVGQEDLSAVAGAHQARNLVQGQAHVVRRRWRGFAGVKAHPDTDRRRSATRGRPVHAAPLTLPRPRSRASRRRRTTRHLRCQISDHRRPSPHRRSIGGAQPASAGRPRPALGSGASSPRYR